MSSENRKAHNKNVVLPTAPGSNPSSFPGISVPIEPNRMESGGDREEPFVLPGGAAPNGAVIEEPTSRTPEVDPPYEYTPDKEDLDLLIM